jgi:signal transduction histidine kinase
MAGQGSLSRRLLAGVVLVGLLILLNLSWFGWLMFRSLSEQELSRIMSQTREEAEEVANEVAGEVDDGTPDLVSALVRRQETLTYIDQVLVMSDMVELVQFVDQDGTVLYETRRSTLTKLGESVDSPEGSVPRVETLNVETELPYEVVGVPLEMVEVPVGEVGSFVIGLSQPELERRVQVLRQEIIRKATPIALFTLVVLVSAYVLVLGLLRRGRRLESRARESEQMAYIGTLASGLAHEIRSPLNSLNLNMQMLEEEIEGSGPVAPRRLLTITRSEITRLEGLVTNFLSYARPRALELEDVPAVALFERLRDVLSAQLQSKGIEIEVSDRTYGTLVRVDVDQMNQLLLNLVQNSIAALEESPRERRLGLRIESDGANVVLSVEDNGVGMGAEKMEKVFDLFYSTRKGGTGLGLAIARRIARAHGADLEVGSVEHEGTTVRLRLAALPDSSTKKGERGVAIHDNFARSSGEVCP